MLYVFMGKCSHVQAYLPVDSLNQQTEVFDDGESIDLIDQVIDPASEAESGSFREELLIDVRRFMTTLPERLHNIVYRTYWLDQSQVEIAAELNVTRSAVNQDLAKINKLGRKYFGLPTN